MRRRTGPPVGLVVGAVEILNLRVALVEVEMKVIATVCTDQQTGKHIPLAFMGAALAELSPLFLYLLPCSPRNNWLMHILEDGPVLPVVFKAVLVLIGLGVGLEVENIAAILLEGQDFGDGRTVPVTGAVLGRCSSPPYPLGLPIETRGQDFLLREGAGNLLHAYPVQAHAVDPPHHSSGRLVNNPPLWIVRVLLIPIGLLTHRLTGIALGLVANTLLLLISLAYHSLNKFFTGASSFSPLSLRRWNAFSPLTFWERYFLLINLLIFSLISTRILLDSHFLYGVHTIKTLVCI